MISTWLNSVTKGGWLLIILIVSLTGYCSYYTVNNLKMDFDTSNMLSSKLEFKGHYEKFKKSFPQEVDTMLIVIDGVHSDEVYLVTRKFHKMLLERGDLFNSVFSPEIENFFQTNGLLYLDDEELDDITQKMIDAQPFLSRLGEEFSLKGYLELLIEAYREKDIDLKNIEPLNKKLIEALHTSNDPEARALSWSGLMNKKTGKTQHIIIVQPKLDFSDMQPAKKPMAFLEKEIASFMQQYSVRIRMTGSVPLNMDELSSAQKGATTAGIFSLILVMTILAIGLRSFTLTIATLITLVTGLILTLSFATFAIGTLNMISVAFAALYIGMSVDYAIHFCLRYQDYKGSSLSSSISLGKSFREVGPSILLCSISTAIGFYAFIPTSYSGVAELGLIAGTGMFISLFLNFTLLPSLMSLLHRSEKYQRKLMQKLDFAKILNRLYHLVKYGCILLALASSLLIFNIRFDDDPLNLKDPSYESVSTMFELLQTDGSAMRGIDIVVPLNSLDRQLTRLKDIPSVKEAISIRTLVPNEQDEKLESVDELATVLGDTRLKNEKLPRIEEKIIKEKLHSLHAQLKQKAPGDELLKELDIFINSTESKERLERTQTLLLKYLPLTYERIALSLGADEIDVQSIPDDIRSRWLTPDGEARILAIPKDEYLHLDRFNIFYQHIKKEFANATGPTITVVESGNTVVNAFRQALTGTLVLIAVLLFVVFRKLSDMFRVMVPLILSGLLTCTIAHVLGIPFNFANIIALPLILGLGVDNSIHMVHSWKKNEMPLTELMQSSTTKGIIMSSLTTICSFCSLAFTTHLGISSMGKMLSIGIVCSLLCTLLFLPTCLYAKKELVDGN